MSVTSIEWCDHTVNPIRARNLETGAVGHFCERTSPGCARCYASDWNRRVRPNGTRLIGTGLEFIPENRDKVEFFLDESKLIEVLRRKKPTRYFWCDMTDLFGDWVPDAWIDQAFAVMALTPQHTHLVLTKRAARMLAYMTGSDRADAVLDEATDIAHDHIANTAYLQDAAERSLARWPPPNVWLGVSVENQHFADERIPLLLQTPAVIRFISAEPLLGPVDISAWTRPVGSPGVCLSIDGEWWHNPGVPCGHCRPPLDWVIVGGESGPGARPCALEWIESIGQQCRGAGVSVFVKQLGAYVVSETRTMPAGDVFSPEKLKLEHFSAQYPDEVWAWRAGLKSKKGGDPAEWPEDLRVREFPKVASACD